MLNVLEISKYETVISESQWNVIQMFLITKSTTNPSLYYVSINQNDRVFKTVALLRITRKIYQCIKYIAY